MELPTIIQGGMGVGVSSWRLAHAVSFAGQLGVVSGTALDLVLARRLQDGDPDGSSRRALAHFPDQAMAQRVQDKYFVRKGREPGRPYRPIPKLSVTSTPRQLELSVVASFVEVWLAKEGHRGVVGINCLEKVQMATPAALFGAMLAGVDYVLMGAGIPREIPRLLTDLAAGRPGGVSVDVVGGDALRVRVDPRAMLGDFLPELVRPKFLAIVSAPVLASVLHRNEDTRPDGFVVEGFVAGGHNAPPRGPLTLDELGQPVYGSRDDIDAAKIAQIGLPFWVAGGYDTPDAVAAALAAGATGVQVGSVFAVAQESGLTRPLRDALRAKLARGVLEVRTEAFASPTGFPFKVAQLDGTLSDETLFAEREPLCDLGYLRTPYKTSAGRISYRCASEPAAEYVRKGGKLEDTIGRKCLCNGLSATIGLGQTRVSGYSETPLVTFGADSEGSRALAARHPEGWTADQALAYLLAS
jgi:NAD(P)H-dependent flavin oxidoreductase YrpB (nitropropane dioxygenase family)